MANCAFKRIDSFDAAADVDEPASLSASTEGSTAPAFGDPGGFDGAGAAELPDVFAVSAVPGTAVAAEAAMNPNAAVAAEAADAPARADDPEPAAAAEAGEAPEPADAADMAGAAGALPALGPFEGFDEPGEFGGAEAAAAQAAPAAFPAPAIAADAAVLDPRGFAAFSAVSRGLRFSGRAGGFAVRLPASRV